MAKLPIADFITARLKEYDSGFEVRKGTGFAQLFINPMQFLLQPVADEAALQKISQSFLRILQQEDPDAFDEEAVDALAANLFVTRISGGTSSGMARVYYTEPVNREWPANGIQIQGSNGLYYTNPSPYIITYAEMSSQLENESYYYDIPIVSVDSGTNTALDIGGLVSIDNDPDALTVANPVAISGGTDRETNTQLIDRVKRSIAVRDLVTGKGFAATMFENFGSFLTELQPIGFGDPEMMRDIQYNTHIGGKIDGFFKTSAITTSYQNFVGLLPDTSRQAYSSTNVQMLKLNWIEVGSGNFDVTYDEPIVQQTKATTISRYLSPVDLSGSIDLSSHNRIYLSIAGVEKGDLYLGGSIPSTTTKSEIINKINMAFGYVVAYSVGNSIELRTRSRGTSAEIIIGHPTSYHPIDNPTVTALTSVFGLTTQTSFYGDGPLVFTPALHFTYNTDNGTLKRILGSSQVALTSTGTAARNGALTTFTDPTTDIFLSVVANDILTVNPNDTDLTHQIDYRVVQKIDNNTLILDTVLWFRGSWNAETNYPALADGVGYYGESYKVSIGASRDLGSGVITFAPGDYVTFDGLVWVKNVTPLATGITYIVRRTGIKNNETVYVQYWYNPLSIDVGPNVQYVDPVTSETVRGIRPGREEMTISSVAFLRINSIEIIDPITLEPTGEVLATGGGYGQGGYGEGPYGSGGSNDYTLVVNLPTERFSAFEDSYIVLHPGYIGMSVRVNFDYVPECVSLHDFVRSDYERVLDADILMRHLLPAYVSGSITYKVDSTDSTIPDNDTLTGLVKEYINTVKAGEPLTLSKIKQYIARTTDPYDRYGTSVHPFTLTAMIHNTDGSTTIISSDDELVVPTPVPFPKYTTKPLSPRITHWIGDNIVLIRET